MASGGADRADVLAAQTLGEGSYADLHRAAVGTPTRRTAEGAPQPVAAHNADVPQALGEGHNSVTLSLPPVQFPNGKILGNPFH
jgi:hypothetical protein